MVKFRFNPAQTYYWDHKTRRNILLKARQKGLSKIVDADQLIDCIRKPTNAVVISHEKEATKRLFEAVRGYVDNMDVKPSVSIDSSQEMKFPKRGSSYFIGTAGQKAFGRGDTVHRAHLSEAAFYDDLEKILAGIGEAAEMGQIDIESTPNGRDQFHDEWIKAKNGRSSYTPIFIPWFIDQEYSADSLTQEEKDGLSVAVREMFALPEDEFISTLDEDERRLVARVAEEWQIILTAGQLKWRRYKIWDKGALFFQEYPEDDVSCFLTTSSAVFPKVIVDVTRRIPLDRFATWKAPGQNANEQEEWKRGFKKRRKWGGLDGAEGVIGGDWHNFSVVDIEPGTNQGVVIFDYTSQEPIEEFDHKVAAWCREFNVYVGIEGNGIGNSHIQNFKRDKECQGVAWREWQTGATNRPTMISDLSAAYRKAELIETYPEGEDQLKGMEYTEKKTNATAYRAEAGKKKHDDRVFGRAIAWGMRNLPAPGVTFL